MKKILAFLSLGLYLVAGDLESGVEAYKSQNFSLAKSKFELACQSGEKMGCENLAVMYVLGKGMSKDSASAIKFYEKGCELGSKEACSGAGGIYVSSDKEKARTLLNKGCELGDGFSCATAGSYLLEEKKFKEAYALFEKACKIGDSLGCQFASDLKRSKRL